MAIFVDDPPRESRVRVGSASPSAVGPLGTADWQTHRVQRRRGPVDLHYQETTFELIENARIRVHGAVDIPCHRATREQLRMLDATLALVPPRHLELVNQRKPQGFLLADTTGRGPSLSYTGGLNPRVDYPSTPVYNESRLILITYGALWQYRQLGVCPTVLHEIGHVMTHRGEISYAPFPPPLAQRLEGTRVSRNPGRLEALCNAYMYLLCYASADAQVQAFGSTPASAQKSRETRNALRQCPAFRSPLADDVWQRRLAER